MNMKEFRLVRISGKTPYERGVQYGKAAREEINNCIDTVSYTHLDVYKRQSTGNARTYGIRLRAKADGGGY